MLPIGQTTHVSQLMSGLLGGTEILNDLPSLQVLYKNPKIKVNVIAAAGRGLCIALIAF